MRGRASIGACALLALVACQGGTAPDAAPWRLHRRDLAAPDPGPRDRSGRDAGPGERTDRDGGAAPVPLCQGGQCNSAACHYLSPPLLYLTGSASELLQVVDHTGETVDDAVAFTTHQPFIAVSALGEVRALRAEGSTEFGAWVDAASETRPVANSAIVRVFDAPVDVAYEERVTPSTLLRFPSAVDGPPLAEVVDGFQVPTVNEYAYGIQSELVGVRPFEGCTQIFQVDLSPTLAQTVCGVAGNPIRVGWSLEGGEWANCFLFPDTAPRSPNWGVLYHELAHNFTLASAAFLRGLAAPLPLLEGLATALSFTTMRRLLAERQDYPLLEETRESISAVLSSDEGYSLDRLHQWLTAGALFEQIDPDVIDGIWLTHRAEGPADFGERFFYPLRPACEDALNPELALVASLGEVGCYTFFASLVSAAAGVDLASTFEEQYSFPIDEGLFTASNGSLTEVLAGGCE